MPKIDPEHFEREQRDLFDYGDIKQTAHHAGFRYSTFTKQIEPENPTPSIATEFLMFLYGCHETRPELEAKVWALVCQARRNMLPREDESSEIGEAIAACGNFVSVAARSEDGLKTPREVEAARQDVLSTVERLAIFPLKSHIGNLGG
jgi:hypothetical protein